MIRRKEKSMKWIRIDSGEYESEDERFYILKEYNVTFGNHWCLYDNNEKNYYKSRHHEYTLKDCKSKAESIVESEKRALKGRF